jgi:hypothetical protein
MLLKGLLVVASGFIFIFSPGIPMRLISQHKPDYKKDGLYWGIGIWIIAFFISTFIQNFIRQIATSGQGTVESSASLSSLAPYLIGSIFTTLLLQLGMLIFLRNRVKKDEDITSDGLALGFGIGLITQVFTGLSLIGVGAGLIFGNMGIGSTLGSVQSQVQTSIADTAMFSVIITLLSMILYRIALLIVSAIQGYLVSKTLQGKPFNFLTALLISVLFTWSILILQLLLGESNPGQILGVTSTITSIITSVLYLVISIFGFRWLSNELKSSNPKKSSKRK